MPPEDWLMTPTPLIRLTELFPQHDVYAKCEFLAPSGWFKIRGAEHLLAHLARQGSAPLLVVPSMGNTALGAAAAAKERGVPMVGVVPESISRAKDEKLQALGVELVKIAGGGSELLARATEIARERGGYFVHPHLDPLWTDGYRAIAAEILAELPDCRSIVLPLGGGGLLMGLASYLQQQQSPARLYACEPHNYPKYASFDHPRTRTIADGLILETPHAVVAARIGELEIPISLVQDDAIARAMRDLYYRHALVVEPSSAITAAFAQQHAAELAEPICLVLTGGNIARADFDRLASVGLQGPSA